MTEQTPTAIDVTGSIEGELAVDAIDRTATVRYVLRLVADSGTERAGDLVIGAIELPSVRSWNDLPGAVVTDDLVDIADGQTLSRAGAGQLTLGGETWLARVRRLEFRAGPDPARVGIELLLSGDDADRAALTVRGTVALGAVRVRSRDEAVAHRLLDVDKFSVDREGELLMLGPAD